ncbi:hAT family C-terminal dimerization region [Phytophthora infestans]|uniref:HAT family C-terminal dimerization region n=1 Tax=Phytophthora infestans TaxID=4787 RepID=A0A8S9V964_PHYIN|nr:hAT family C-terminal dimerization region [Phytophthora infestans]
MDADLADRISALGSLSARFGIATTEAQKAQIGDEANSYQTLKHRWPSKTRSQQADVAPLLWYMDIEKKHSTKYPLLAQLAYRTYTIMTSSATSERVAKLLFIYANAGDKDAKTSVLYNKGRESEGGDSDVAEDDKDGSNDESMEGSSDDFSPRSMSMHDDFNAFSYECSQEQKEST